MRLRSRVFLTAILSVWMFGTPAFAQTDRGTITGAVADASSAVIPGAQVLDIPNRDHMRAVGDKVYKTGVVDFLSRRE